MFEQKLKRLEEIVKLMEAQDLEMEKSLALFEEGVVLTRECQNHLNQAEQKVKMLMGIDSEGQAVTKDFRPTSD